MIGPNLVWYTVLRTDPPEGFHLPEPVLGVDEAPDDQQVVLVLSVDVGYAVLVPQNRDRGACRPLV